ncbi:hypothetical protein Tco_0117093 [Tanacetum coccineum]
MNDGILRGLILVKTRRIRIIAKIRFIEILVQRLTLKSLMKTPAVLTTKYMFGKLGESLWENIIKALIETRVLIVDKRNLRRTIKHNDIVHINSQEYSGTGDVDVVKIYLEINERIDLKALTDDYSTS